MAKYDGLIIPRSYNDYINKSDPLGVSQALQLTGVMDDTPTAGSSKPVKSSGLVGLSAVDVVETGNMHPVTSNAVAETAADLEPVDEVTLNNMHSVTSNAVANANKWNYLGYLNNLSEYTNITLDAKYNEFMLEVMDSSGNIRSSVYSATRLNIGTGTQYLCVGGNSDTLVTYVANIRLLTYYRTVSSNIIVYAR